jgi:hypothetical protein
MKLAPYTYIFVLLISVKIKPSCHNCEIVWKLSNFVKTVKFSENNEIMSVKFSIFVKIIKFGENHQILKKFSNFENIVKFGEKIKYFEIINFFRGYSNLHWSIVNTSIFVCRENWSHKYLFGITFWILIRDSWRFSSFFKAYNLFQSNWNFMLFHINNEISIKFQHFCLVDEC